MPMIIPAMPTPVSVGPRLWRVPATTIPGIAAGVAFAAGDAFGSAFTVTVPPRGRIIYALFHDLDDEGINKTLHLYSDQPSTIASGDPYATSDSDMLLYVGRIQFNVFHDMANNQIGIPPSADLPLPYVVTSGLLWMQLQTDGADNIAAGAMPRISMIVEVGGQ